MVTASLIGDVPWPQKVVLRAKIRSLKTVVDIVSVKTDSSDEECFAEVPSRRQSLAMCGLYESL